MEESRHLRVQGNDRTTGALIAAPQKYALHSPIGHWSPMTCATRPAIASLCVAALLAVTSLDAAAGTPQPQPRTGAYKIVKRGPKAIRARCLEGGNVVVPTHEKATAAKRDHDIHEACKTVDYSK
jgi:hypothetical protein